MRNLNGFRITQIIFWLGLSVFFGGMMVLGPIVAGHIFQTIESSHVTVASMNPGIDQGKLLAGNVFGGILAAFNYVEVTCIVFMVGAALVQSALHFHLKHWWAWLRLGLLAVLALLVFRDVFTNFPAVLRQQQLWLQNVSVNAKLAAAHKDHFNALHTEAEITGMIETLLLLAMLVVSAWALSWPTRLAHARQVAIDTGVLPAETAGGSSALTPFAPAPSTSDGDPSVAVGYGQSPPATTTPRRDVTDAARNA